MARARAKRPSRPASRSTRHPPTVIVRPPRPVALDEERPHAHVVCRICGRIQPLELTELDCHVLTELASHRPDGWSAERIAFSVAGACQRCREGHGTG
jgi:hypothetical protein